MDQVLRCLLVLTSLLSGLVMRSGAVPRASHRVVTVPISPDVRLEVLDWGGHGPPLVFLAGFGNTGHVFDGFAPQFADRYHVLAITRRGFGASSRPATGYDTDTLVRDILATLDSLGIRRASFVGHSFAGTELSLLGAYHADRVVTLVYLDASYDFAHLYADSRWQRAFPIPRPPAPSTTDIATLRRWLASVMGPDVPDDEIRNLISNGRVPPDTTFQRGADPTRLAGISVPVLAIWAAPRSVKDWYPYWDSRDAAARVRLQSSFDDQAAVRRDHVQRFREHVRGARVMAVVVAARQYIFLTHPRAVADGLRAFLASRDPGSP